MFYKNIVFTVSLVFVFLSVFCTSSSVSAGQVNSFIYHRFDEFKYPSTNISAEIFRQQLEHLKQNNIAVIGLEEVAERLSSGSDLPEHAVALSVDDGYLSFYQVALPIVEEYGFPVSLFVNTDAVGKHGYMNWEQLKDSEARGVIIGNHTASHPYLVEMAEGETQGQWRQRIAADIEKAQRALSAHLDGKISLFVYPYGEYSPEVIDVVKNAGFTAAFAQQSGVISELSDLFTLPRFPMGGPFATLAGFKSKAGMQQLMVTPAAPVDPVVTDNPPALRLKIPDVKSHKSVNCFVQGDNVCRLLPVSDLGSHWYQIVADRPLTGRRNKYTLTVQNDNGEWLWFSQLWINADNPAGR